MLESVDTEESREDNVDDETLETVDIKITSIFPVQIIIASKNLKSVNLCFLL